MNKINNMRRVLVGGSLLVAMAAAGLATNAVAAPPVKVVVPYIAGGVTDQAARVLVERMAQILGDTMIVENRPGAGSRLGAQAVIQAAGDGTTLLFTNISLSTLPLVDPTARIDPLTSLAPVGLAAVYGGAIVVNSSLPVNTLQELVAYAKANPGKISYGSAGMGSGSHFAAEYYKHLTQTHAVHIPYRSTAAALTDVAGGVLQMGIDATAKPFIDSGKVKALAIIGAQRDPRMPNVPTAAEAGVKGLDFNAWLGLLAPASTPVPVVDRLNKAMNTALQDPGVRRQFESMGLIVRTGGPERLTQQLREDATLYRKIIKDAQLKFD